MIRHYDISHFRAPYKAATLQGFGAETAPAGWWFYDANPDGRVRMLTPAAAQVVANTIANKNPNLQDVWIYARPIASVGSAGVAQIGPDVTAAQLFVVPRNAEKPSQDQGVPVADWLASRMGKIHAIINSAGGALELSEAALRGGQIGLLVGPDPQQIAGEKQPIASAVYYNYTPVMPGPQPGGGDKPAEQPPQQPPKKAAISPLGIATIAIAVGAIGYLVLSTKKK